MLEDGVLRVIVGPEREQVTEHCVLRGVIVGTVRVSS